MLLLYIKLRYEVEIATNDSMQDIIIKIYDPYNWLANETQTDEETDNKRDSYLLLQSLYSYSYSNKQLNN